MASIVENKKGFKILKLNYKEFLSTGGLSICDGCNKIMFEGYYIAVLNYSYCKEDYEEWIKSAIKYDEDLSYEESKFNSMYNFLS